MFLTLKQESVIVIKFSLTAKFDIFLFNVRNVMIVFWFYANEAFGHALTCLSAQYCSRVFLKVIIWGASLNEELELVVATKSLIFDVFSRVIPAHITSL